MAFRFPPSLAPVSDEDGLSSTDESAFGLFIFFFLSEQFSEILIFFQRPIDYIPTFWSIFFSIVVIFVGS